MVGSKFDQYQLGNCKFFKVLAECCRTGNIFYFRENVSSGFFRDSAIDEALRVLYTV